MQKKFSTLSTGLDKMKCYLCLISFTEDADKEYREDGRERMLAQYRKPNEEELPT